VKELTQKKDETSEDKFNRILKESDEALEKSNRLLKKSK